MNPGTAPQIDNDPFSHSELGPLPIESEQIKNLHDYLKQTLEKGGRQVTNTGPHGEDSDITWMQWIDPKGETYSIEEANGSLRAALGSRLRPEYAPQDGVHGWLIFKPSDDGTYQVFYSYTWRSGNYIKDELIESDPSQFFEKFTESFKKGERYATKYRQATIYMSRLLTGKVFKES